MTKQVAILAVMVCLVLGTTFGVVRWCSGDVKMVLDRQSSALLEVEKDLTAIRDYLPDLRSVTQQTWEGLIDKEAEFVRIGDLLDPKQRSTLIMAFEFAVKDLEVSLSHLIVSVEIVNTLQEILRLLQANQNDLYSLHINTSLNRESVNALREEADGRIERAEDLRRICDAFTDDLGTFLSQQRQIWSMMSDQMENLLPLAKGDPEIEGRLQLIIALLGLSGDYIQRVSSVHSSLERISSRQRGIEKIHKGLLTVLR